jgi:hypothetical protein
VEIILVLLTFVFAVLLLIMNGRIRSLRRQVRVLEQRFDVFSGILAGSGLIHTLQPEDKKNGLMFRLHRLHRLSRPLPQCRYLPRCELKRSVRPRLRSEPLRLQVPLPM